jgi:hypothetical protein
LPNQPGKQAHHGLKNGTISQAVFSLLLIIDSDSYPKTMRFLQRTLRSDEKIRRRSTSLADFISASQYWKRSSSKSRRVSSATVNTQHWTNEGQKDKEDLEEISSELELQDEDDKVP